MRNSKRFLGIDIGTSSVKMLLVDDTIEIVDSVKLDCEISQPKAGWREVEPKRWLDLVMQGFKILLSKHDPKTIQAIGITGQMHTTVFLDREGNSIRPAILWDDIRSRELVDRLKTDLKGKEDCVGICKILSTGTSTANLLWLKENEPHHFKQISKFLISPDYIVYKLTGNCTMDYCGASTSCLYDIYSRAWSHTMRALLELKEDFYPIINPACQCAGKILKKWAEELGISEDVMVITGTGDNLTTAVNTGCIGKGNTAISLGTSGIIMAERKQIDSDAKGKPILFSLFGTEFSYLLQGAIQSNGTAYDWWMKDILGYADHRRINEAFHCAERKPNLLFYPHLIGEKTIHADPMVKGAFIGLSLDITKEDMMLAVIEGLCFGYKELAEKMQIALDQNKGLFVVGGGSNSDIWVQTLANIMNVKVLQTTDRVSPAYGIALLSMLANGQKNVLEKMHSRLLAESKTYYPDKELTEFYQSKYEKYVKIYAALNEVLL